MAESYTPNEMMTIAAARALRNEDVCFVGIDLPSAAANLARLTHAPALTLVYESGTIATRPDVLPLSIGDGELCETALITDLCVFEPEAVTKEMTVTSIHPGVTRAQIEDNTGWPVRFAAHVGETPAPTAHELGTLRELHARTARAHGQAA